MGHFAVAKWCGVKVERFSIGFGPVIFKVTRGETEYALSLVPFGGYVKMLGQDDADPGQLTDARIARDPRSYTSKSVPQRMAIISAGVINNLVSAVLFFIIAFLMGVSYDPAIIGAVTPGGPAWKAGLRAGDHITRIDTLEDPQLWFYHLKMSVALSSGPVDIAGERREPGTDGPPKPFKTTVYPEMKSEEGALFPVIKVEPTLALRFNPERLPLTEPGTPAAEAKPPFQPNDLIRKIEGIEIPAFADLQRVLSDTRDKPVTITVERNGKLVDVRVGPTKFRTVGLQMDIGKIVAIQKGSPADGKLQEGDKITHVTLGEGETEQAVGDVIDPLQLPDLIAAKHGREIKLRIQRQPEKGDAVTEVVTLVPEDRLGLDREAGCVLGRPDVDPGDRRGLSRAAHGAEGREGQLGRPGGPQAGRHHRRAELSGPRAEGRGADQVLDDRAQLGAGLRGDAEPEAQTDPGEAEGEQQAG